MMGPRERRRAHLTPLRAPELGSGTACLLEGWEIKCARGRRKGMKEREGGKGPEESLCAEVGMHTNGPLFAFVRRLTACW